MPEELPIEPGNPDQRFNTTLVDEEFIFDFRWNERAGAWYMAIYTEEEDPIVHGIKVVSGTLLAGHVSNAIADFPAGVFIVVDSSGQSLDGVGATLDDLGDRVSVVFFTQEELNDIVNG